MQDSKNLIFAIILSTAILFCWQFFYTAPRIEAARKQQQIAEKLKAEEAKLKSSVPQEAVDADSPVSNPDILKDRKDVLLREKRIQITTDTIHGSISLKGARFDDITLIEHRTDNSKDSDEVVLLSPSGTKDVYFSDFGWIAGDGVTIVPDSQTIWYSESDKLTPEKPVTLSWDNNHGLKFFITINIDKDYLFTITKKVENYGNNSQNVRAYGRINRARSEQMAYYISHEGAIAVLNGVLSEVSYEDIKEGKKVELTTNKGWLGFADKYWLTTIIPNQNESFDASYSYFYKDGLDRYQVDFLGQKTQIDSGKSIESKTNLFTGPKKVNKLDEYGKKLQIPLFDRAVDFGILYFITKPIFKLLMVFYGWVGNFGIAIMMLTVTLKLCLFPLANKSYVSMHHLKRLQPKMLDLRERYKNDKVALNKAVMELYKTEKVNPMSGCLPLLIQMPIFFALYKVLFVTIEMRHAPFFGWIKDLSAPDPTNILNLFGLIPYTPPSLIPAIGVWPILMGITMYLQQKMSPPPSDPTQATVIKLLPFIFVFLFATFPAGMVIYWAWSNTLSILQQWVITRRLPK
jgi:YidC/Oxa1 family membrane protein insertase